MEKIDSTDPMLSTEKQLHVEVTNEDKPLQPLSTSTSLIPSADVKYDEIKLDNLPSHQKHIMNRLESIRENKQRILATLRELKENTKEGEFPNKELMSKMIGSYDALTAQEEQYVQLMQKIVNLRENAADDVQHENEKISDESSRRGNVMQDGNAESNNKLSAEEIDNDVEEMNSELSKLGVVTGKAVAVSIMNDKLLETLQLHHEKKAALEELHRRKRETQKGIANEALQQVEMARLKIASEQEQVERKRKTLERLRREAQRRGIKLGPGSASEPDIVVEPQPEPKSITEAKLRAKLQAKKKQNTELEDDTGPPVPDDLAPAERIPPVLENEIEQQQQMEGKISEITGGNGCVGKKKRKGKKGREQQKQSDTINSSIREKLAAIAARKERMREIRAQLAKPVEESPPDMDETFRNALQQLKSITEMRKQLELLREKGAELPEETAELLERQLEAEENASKENEIKAPNEMDANYNFETPFEESAQAMEVVRNSFLKMITKKSGSNSDIDGRTDLMRDDDLLIGYHHLTTEDSQRLKNIEQALEEQRQLLETIASQNHQHQSSLPITTESCQTRIAILRKCFLTAKPQLLIHLGNILLDLAKRQLRNDLDSVLRDILQNSNDGQLPNEIDKHQNDVNDDNHELASIESESHEAVELIKFIHTESANRFERGLSRELTPDEVSKFEQAKRHLSSGKAKLKKQQTLEKIRNRTEIIVDEQQFKKMDTEHSEGLENDICTIIDGILPLIRQHSELNADDGFMRQLRDELLRQASVVCFPENATPTDLFRNQLSTIIDDTLSQYVGNKVGEVREELIFDTSEVLYNELAFFQLMYNIDNSVN
ncbi:Pericentriolar material 1 protein [Dirofilaria immitis]